MGADMMGLNALGDWLAGKLRRIIRRELQREYQHNLVTHTAARQALDLYEMRLETLDTRLAKRILHLEARIAELEARETIERLPTRVEGIEPQRKAG